MSMMSASERERYFDLLVDRAADALSPEDAGEFERLSAMPGAGEVEASFSAGIGRTIAALDNTAEGDLPEALRDRLVRGGRAVVGGPIPIDRTGATGGASVWVTRGLAAAVLALGVSTTALIWGLANRSTELRERGQRLASLEAQIEENRVLLASAEENLETWRSLHAESEGRIDEIEAQRLAEAERNTRLARQLATATEDLTRAELEIARLEAPEDPEVLAELRRELLLQPGTIRIPWQPFSVPGGPDPVQTEVAGDVIWNDRLETGYLRFDGLAVNDPDEFQYQVWVIDERGMEQKVSGGVFNSTRFGELIVPIEPGIDVGNVQVFAITVEDPGGIWVPDLTRRVVVAPREGG